MATNGVLDFQSTNKLIFRGTSANVVIDTQNLSLGVGHQGEGAPEARLSVIGNDNLSGTPNNAIASFRATTAIPGTNDAGVVIGSINGNSPYIADVSTASLGLSFYTQNAQRMRINSSGNVEVGTANLFVDTVNSRVGIGIASPLSRLHVGDGSNPPAGTVDADASLTLDGAGRKKVEQGKPGIYHRENVGLGLHSDYKMSFEVGGSSTLVEAMRILDNGNVGIGLTDPEVKLHVKGGPICVERTYPDGQQAGIVFMEDHTNNDCMFIAYDASGTAEPNADEHLCFYSKNGGGPDPSATDCLLMMKMRSDGHIQIGDAEYKQNHTYLTIASDGGNTWEQGIRFIHHGMDNSNMYGWRIRGSDITDSFHINRIDAGNQERDAFTLNASGMLILNQGSRPGENGTNRGMKWTNTDNNNYWNLFNSNNDHFRFTYNGANKGWVDPNHSGPSEMNDFTGQHRTFIKDVPFTHAEQMKGLIVSSDQNKYVRLNTSLEIGLNAISINESIPNVSLSKIANDKKCFGVISGSEDPETRTEKYGVFGSTFEKEKGDTRVYINSVGEGAIWVTNINGPLESGDYITTSNVAGYGQKQDSEFLANYTVAKITMDCDFDPVTQPVQVIKKDEDGENILDEHDQIQWEDDPSGATEKAYKIRYLDADGNITDEANAVHTAAFVGCTYHCG